MATFQTMKRISAILTSLDYMEHLKCSDRFYDLAVHLHLAEELLVRVINVIGVTKSAKITWRSTEKIIIA